MAKYGYARVSSKSQEKNSSLESQKQELISKEIPKENIKIEVGSAASSMEDRLIFQELTNF